MMERSDVDGANDANPCANGNDHTPEMTEQVYKIGHMAKQYQVTLRTLRFYEGNGLLRPKRQGMTRLYSSQDCQRLEMILRGRQLGFSLAEIHNLIQTPDDSIKITDLESALGPDQMIEQIRNLERQREELDKAINALRSAHRRMYESDEADPQLS